ncbi:MAG: hypothetical protein JSW38_05015 [Dehalococcoidia bacterium]|nr:MAG: hypothetical protein JSW38_05015 [Dehalococcoidia bacterium]
MREVLYDPWLVAVISQVVGGVLSGLTVHYLTRSRSQISDREIKKLFKWKVHVPEGTPFSFLLNWRYAFFYLILLLGIAGLTLLQDPLSINWYRIVIYVVLITWWSMVALNVFVLMDGAGLQGRLPNPILLFVSIIFPIIGHTKSVAYTLFVFITKMGLGVFLYGALSRFADLGTRSIISSLLVVFALVDTLFYAYLFLPRYPEFYNWREGRFIIAELGWPKWQ